MVATNRDPLYEMAKDIISITGRAYASTLQRMLSIGYARAAKIIDELVSSGDALPPSNLDSENYAVDSIFDEAVDLTLDLGKVSTSLLQKRFSIGYARAARVIDELEAAGCIEKANGFKPRKLLLNDKTNSRLEINKKLKNLLSDYQPKDYEDTPTTFPNTKGEFIILILDDEDTIREMFAELFTTRGYKVIQRPDAKDLFEILDTQNIGLLILDILMPFKDGIQVLTEIKKNKKYSKLPIIISSNLDSIAIIKVCFNLGADWYLRINQLTPEDYIKEVEEFIPTQKRRIYAHDGKEYKYFAIEELNIEFGGPNHPEKDEKLMDLMDKAHNKLIPVFLADVPIKRIKPNCSFKPDLDGKSNWRKIFHEDFENGRPHFLHIYPEGKCFIMSDDYISYYSYLNEGFVIVPCIIFGDVDDPEVTNKKKIIWDYQSFRDA